MEKIEDIIKYKERIVDIPLSKIEINKLNPRKRFVEAEEDELIESIVAKGILNPIIVYKKDSGAKYVVLDGERRYRASTKLKNKKIPAHILEREPSIIENLSIMFHIHNVREEWTNFAIALSMRTVVDEMGKDIRKLTKADREQIKKVTSLTDYRIKKYQVFFTYPKDVVDRFLKSEMQDEPDRGVDPDILAEMNRPIKKIEKILPDFIKEYSIKMIIDACIKKKANNVVKTNRDFRLLTKSLNAVEKGEIRKSLLNDKLEEFVTDLNITPQTIYDETSHIYYQIKSILDKSEDLVEELSNLDMRRVTKNERTDLKNQLSSLMKIIEDKIIK